MGLYFDSHCHLQDERFEGRLDEVLTRARAVGLTAFACCGCQENDWEAVLELSSRHRDIVPLLGLHPWYVRGASVRWLARLEEGLGAHRAGLGECGLDFALEDADRELQERVFRSQLELARGLERPVSIHCRKAWESLLRISREIGLPGAGAMVHSFSGSAEVALQLQELGYHLSFSCSLANPRNRRAAKALRAVWPERLLFETDAPDIAPPGIELNEPANIRQVSAAAAEILGVDECELAARVHRNARALFAALLPEVASGRPQGLS